MEKEISPQPYESSYLEEIKMRMTPTNQKQKGKYNSQKEWSDEGKTGKPFVSASDSMAYVEKKKFAVLDKMEGEQNSEEDVEQETVQTQEQEEAAPYQRVDYKKRYDDLKRHHDRKINEMKEQMEKVRAEIRSNRPTYTPPKSEDELNKFKEENPDIYAVVESVSHLRATEELKDLQEELKQVQERLLYEEAKRAYMELKAAVPDYEQIKVDPDFHEWAEQQPKEIQDWVYNNRTNVQLAIKAINLYKADRGTAQKPPRVNKQSDQRGSAAEAVVARTQRAEPSNGEKIWKRSEIAKLSWQQYEKYREEIDAAFAEGRIENG